MSNLKYTKEQYETCDYYGGDMDCDVDYITKKLVKCRSQHQCMGGCNNTIQQGEYALCERGFLDGKPVSCYTCIPCLDSWIEESGQSEVDE